MEDEEVEADDEAIVVFAVREDIVAGFLAGDEVRTDGLKADLSLVSSDSPSNDSNGSRDDPRRDKTGASLLPVRWPPRASLDELS